VAELKELSRNVVIVNEFGMHARSAAKVAAMAQNATADIWIQKGDARADASSIIDILTLGCEKGTQITLGIEDPADMDILSNIFELITNGFGE
jgi:phosphotransferase system HPr (HPr) family protein